MMNKYSTKFRTLACILNHDFIFFQDEVLAISEKVVIRLEDLITWITAEAEWTWGRLAKSEQELKSEDLDPSRIALPRRANGTSFNLTDNLIDFSDIENEKNSIGNYF